MASRAEWMALKRFGLMVHWFPSFTTEKWSVPPQRGERCLEPDKVVAQFDLDRFMADYQASGAEWLIFTIGQNTGFYASPNSVIERLAGSGYCSKRDLIREIAVRVKALGHRFIAYLPGDICANTDILQNAFGWKGEEGATQETFLSRYGDFVGEYASRFGTLLDGWWFDGGAHFVKAGHDYLLNGRAGNSDAALAFNDGSLCVGHLEPLHSQQDYLAGEVEVVLDGQIRLGRKECAPLLDPRSHPQQPSASCLWHALVPIDCMWGHGEGFASWMESPLTIVTPPPGEMEEPLYSGDDLFRLVSDFKAVGGGVTFNVGIFQEGGLGSQSVAQLREIAKRINLEMGCETDSGAQCTP